MPFQTSYRFDLDQGLPGLPLVVIKNVSKTNAAAKRAQAAAGLLTYSLAATAGATVTITRSGQSFAFTAGGTASGSLPSNYAVVLRDAINSSTFLFRDLFASVVTSAGSGAATLTVTSRLPGDIGTFGFAFATSAGGGATLAGTAAGEATGIPFGVIVGQDPGDNDQTFRLPNSTNTRILGLVQNPHIYEQTGGQGQVGKTGTVRTVVPPERNGDVLEQGEIWALLAGTVTPAVGDPVAYRYATAAGLTQVGAVTNFTTASESAFLNTAVFRSTVRTLETGERIAKIAVNIP